MLEEILKELPIYDVYSDIQSQNLPLYVWGGGELASEIESILHEKEIRFDGFFVDDEYINEDRYIKDVVSYSELINFHDIFNVIVGHSVYELYSEMEKRKHVNKVFLLPYVNYHKWDRTNYDSVEKRIDELEKVYDSLEDEVSKRNLLAMLKVHISGDAKHIIEVFEHSNNFYNNDIYNITKDEVFIDVGAYDGDTLRFFLKECGGKYSKVFCIEPDKSNLKRLEEYIIGNDLNVVLLENGLWDSKEQLVLDDGNDQISSIEVDADNNKDGTSTVIDVDCLDNMISESEKVTLIKINYLVGVAEALRGSKRILKNDKPKLAITCGFDCVSIIDIYKAIMMCNPDYRVFLRYNNAMVSKLTMYGI